MTAHIRVRAPTSDALLAALEDTMRTDGQCDPELERVNAVVLARLCLVACILAPACTAEALRAVSAHWQAHSDGTVSVVLSITSADDGKARR